MSSKNEVTYKDLLYYAYLGEAGILARLLYKRMSALIAYVLLRIYKDITPNKATLIHYFLLPITLSSLFILKNPILFSFCLLVHDWLDGVDGTLARYMNKKSDFGAFFDAFTDKLITYTAIFSLVIYYSKFLLGLFILYIELLFQTAIKLYERFVKKVYMEAKEASRYRKIMLMLHTSDILYTLLLILTVLSIDIKYWLLYYLFTSSGYRFLIFLRLIIKWRKHS